MTVLGLYWAFLVAQIVKNLPAMHKTWVLSFGWEDPRRRECLQTTVFLGFCGNSDSKKSTCNAGDLGMIPRLGRSPGRGHGNPLQYSCLENPYGQRSLQSMGLQRVEHDSVAVCRLSLVSVKEGCFSLWYTGFSLQWLLLLQGFPHSSVGKESTCNAGDPGSIPGLGRSAGEGIGYPLQYSWASLVAQLVKNLPAMWETWVCSLGWEDPLEKGKATHSAILAWRIPWTL